MNDEQATSPSEAFKLEFYRQAWEQSRHNERLRDTFTAFFAFAVGATGVFISSAKLLSEGWPWWLPTGLALVGLSVSVRSMTNAGRYTRLQIFVEEQEGLRDWLPPREKRRRGIRIDLGYVIMYGCLFVIFLLLAIGVWPYPLASGKP